MPTHHRQTAVLQRIRAHLPSGRSGASESHGRSGRDCVEAVIDEEMGSGCAREDMQESGHPWEQEHRLTAARGLSHMNRKCRLTCKHFPPFSFLYASIWRQPLAENGPGGTTASVSAATSRIPVELSPVAPWTSCATRSSDLISTRPGSEEGRHRTSSRRRSALAMRAQAGSVGFRFRADPRSIALNRAIRVPIDLDRVAGTRVVNRVSVMGVLCKHPAARGVVQVVVETDLYPWPRAVHEGRMWIPRGERRFRGRPMSRLHWAIPVATGTPVHDETPVNGRGCRPWGSTFGDSAHRRASVACKGHAATRAVQCLGSRKLLQRLITPRRRMNTVTDSGARVRRGA